MDLRREKGQTNWVVRCC